MKQSATIGGPASGAELRAAPRAGSRRIVRLPRLSRFLIGGVLIAIVIAAALFAPWVAPYAPEQQDITRRLQPPSAAYWFGTDGFGRDVLTRVLWGGRVSLSIGIASMLIAVTVGVLIGGLSGWYGGLVDALLMRFTELVLVFPTFFLLILAVATFERSVTVLILVISLTSWPIGARVVRGEVLKMKQRDFVLSAHAIGARQLRILFRHVLPNIASVVIVSATVRVGANILIEAGLSYLGLGVQPPLASWGSMVSEGADVFRSAWWVVAAPAIAITLTVLGFNLLGEGLRELLNPRARRSS